MNFLYKLMLLAGGLLPGACAWLPQQRDAEWPQGIPPRGYYERLYRSDPANQSLQTELEYLTWVRRFYLGSDIYPFGYQDITEAVLGDTSAKRYSVLERKLRLVGKTISGEWAKHKSVKRVTTRMLSVWAQAIQNSVATGRSEAMVDLVAADVRRLLSGDLSPEAVISGRYGADTEIALTSTCSDGAVTSTVEC